MRGRWTWRTEAAGVGVQGAQARLVTRRGGHKQTNSGATVCPNTQANTQDVRAVSW